MDGQIDEAVKGVRSDRMLKLHDVRAREYEEKMLGKTLELLLEEEVTVNDRVYYLGHSREYVRAAVEKKPGLDINDIIKIQAEGFLSEHVLLGSTKF